MGHGEARVPGGCQALPLHPQVLLHSSWTSTPSSCPQVLGGRLCWIPTVPVGKQRHRLSIPEKRAAPVFIEKHGQEEDEAWRWVYGENRLSLGTDCGAEGQALAVARRCGARRR